MNSNLISIEDNAEKSHKLNYLCDNPELLSLHGFIAPAEIHSLVELAAPLYQPSGFSAWGAISTGRTSDSAYLLDSSNTLLRQIAQRAARLLGVPIENIEPLQITRYSPGQYIKDHFDFFSAKSPGFDFAMLQGGQRTHSILVYLNDLKNGGGETIFPLLGQKISPSAGLAVIWQNAKGRGFEDYRTLHRGEPSLTETKLVLNIWVRELAYVKRHIAEQLWISRSLAES